MAIAILSSCSQNGLSHQENKLADSLLIRFSKITPKESFSVDSAIAQSLDILRKGFNETQHCRYFYAKARHARNIQRYNLSELISDSALYIIRTAEKPIKDAGLLMDILTIKSDNNMALRKYNLSGYYAQLALEVADSLSDCKKAAFHTRVALSKYFLKDYDAALTFYQTALTAIEKCDTPLSNIMFKAQIMNNIGLTYLKKNDFISAENIFKKTLEYIVQIKIIHPKAIKDCEMSMVWLKEIYQGVITQNIRLIKLSHCLMIISVSTDNPAMITMMR